MKAFLGSLLRSGLLYLLLFAALAFFVLAWPSIRTGLTSENLQRETMSLQDVRGEIDTARTMLARNLRRTEAGLAELGEAQVQAALADARARRTAKQAELATGGGLFDTIRPSRILARKRLELEIAVLDRQIALLEGRLPLAQAERAFEGLRRIPTGSAIVASNRLCANARQRLREHNERVLIDRTARDVLLREGRARRVEVRQRCDVAMARAERRQRGLAAAQALRDARGRYAAVRESALSGLPNVSERLPRRTLRDIAWLALVALLGILATPYAIRLFFWFVLAPLAERRAAIRLAVPGGTPDRAPIATGESSPSIPVRLAEGEELLVREEYLQTSAIVSEKRTQFLLDWKHPLSSLASGMRFLTRIRGTGSTTTVSAAHDPFAEALVLDLPEGSAVTLQPRTLSAVAQPVGRPVRITSHWRLFSLNAWLTLQLRYLVFHGPARMVLVGGRGIRVERAETGRIFGSGQLVGFSADLDYAVVRNETFWPYFLGRQPLLRDRVMEGHGILIIEEAPRSARTGSDVRSGLEGAFDGLLKAFGI